MARNNKDKEYNLELMLGMTYSLEHLLRARMIPQPDEYEGDENTAVFEKDYNTYIFHSHPFEKYTLLFYLTPDDYDI